MIEIRQETPQDYTEVFETIKRAFEHAEHTDKDEHFLVERLRKSGAFVPELSLVAVINGKIAGHILFTKVKIADTLQIGLAPLSVRPEFQKKEIGTKLMDEGHKIAKKLGYEFSIVMGHPSYYPRVGYLKASIFEIKAPFDVPDEVFMALNLSDKEIQLDGTVEYEKEFFTK